MATTRTKRIYMIDGRRFSTLSETAAEFTRVLGLITPWDGNLDAFNDFLRGGFGTPDDGFILMWQHSDVSRQRLGYEETLHWLQAKVQRCDRSEVPQLQARISAACQQEGETLFDTLVAIIKSHENIDLELV